MKEGKKANADSENIKRKEYKISWRELIWRVWEVDPMICILCGAEMELKFIFDRNEAKSELRRFQKMKYYWYGRWGNRSPHEMMEEAA